MNNRFKPTGLYVAVAALLTFVFLYLSNAPVWHTDVWGHLRFGEYIVREHRLPEHEMFSGDYADQERPYLNFQWLSQAVNYQVYETGARLAGGDDERRLAGGAAALASEHALVTVLRLWIFLLVFQRLTGSLSMALLGVVLTLVFSLEHVLVHRPQMFGELCLALLFLPLSRPILSRRALFFIPAVMVVWANCHGSFPMGFVVLAAFIAGSGIDVLIQKSEIRNPKSEINPDFGFRISDLGSRICSGFRISDLRHDVGFRRLLLAAVLSLTAVALLNPHGPRLFLYSLEMSNHENIRTMEEWKQLPVKNLAGYLFLASILMLAGLMRLSPRRFTPTQVLLLTGLGVQVLAHWRVMVWWGFVVVWVALPHLQALWGLRRRAPIMNPTVAKILTVAAVILALAGLRFSGPVHAWSNLTPEKRVTDATPWRIAEYLREQYANDPSLSPTIFTSETVGDYLFWCLRLEPQVRVFCYTHVHLLKLDHWRECLQVKFADPSWEAILDSHRVQFLIVENTPLYEPLIEAAQASKGRWEVIEKTPLFLAKRRS
jgi:hypothetical protein